MPICIGIRSITFDSGIWGEWNTIDGPLKITAFRVSETPRIITRNQMANLILYISNADFSLWLTDGLQLKTIFCSNINVLRKGKQKG